MTLKEELEILRGESIEVFEGDPMDIPCIETSDPEKLCKNPVVSVHMITYNHEPYIRQAIEGVMMQKTDFEFELVIGEDCSQDKTREICFEYQKKYPEKIRVLWWHENVTKFGGNSRRVRAHCRGEFISFCEGDDYWTSPYKLQKQVDVFRSNADVGLVTTAGIVVNSGGIRISHFKTPCCGHMNRNDLIREILGTYWFGVLTCGVMCRRKILINNLARLKLINEMCLKCGDVQLELAILDTHDVYFMGEEMVAYRRTGTSATGNPRTNFLVGRDGIIIRYAYACITNLCQEKVDIMRWYERYMAESGLTYLPLTKWLYWVQKYDNKAALIWLIGVRWARQLFKRIVNVSYKRMLGLRKYG